VVFEFAQPIVNLSRAGTSDCNTCVIAAFSRITGVIGRYATMLQDEAVAADAVEDSASPAAVKLSEGMGKHERHDQDTGAQGEDVWSPAQIETPDTTDKQVADGKVE
jgi:hypothetical protein